MARPRHVARQQELAIATPETGGTFDCTGMELPGILEILRADGRRVVAMEQRGIGGWRVHTAPSSAKPTGHVRTSGTRNPAARCGVSHG